MRRFAGILILIAAVVAVFIYMRKAPGGRAVNVPARGVVIVKGYVGGEKLGFLEDEKVAGILESRYKIRIDYTKAGSVEMVKGDSAGLDFLWPSSQLALDIYKSRGAPMKKSEIIFNSPIVLYSWDVVTDAMLKSGYAKKNGDIYYVDLTSLANKINAGASWKDIGLGRLYGKMTIYCTDPTKSNSGNMFFGLLANLTNGDVVDQAALPKVMPVLKKLYGRMGYMESSSGDLFEQYLKMGVGAKPIIVGYENQLVEFGIANKEHIDMLRKKTRILYPTPTVWSSHPLIALTPNGVRLLEALRDKDIQAIAWERHGFRSGLINIDNDPKVLDVIGIPESVQSVIPMPSHTVMTRIIDSLSTQ